MILRWFKARRELAAINATLLAENDRLRGEVSRLRMFLNELAIRAHGMAADRSKGQEK